MESSSRQAVSVALVGSGDVAGRHLPGWRDVRGASLDVVVDIDGDRARRFAETWGVERWATDFTEVAADERIRAVDICLPPHLHGEAVRAFAGRGKHVLVEKPLTPTLEEGRELERFVDRTGVVAMVAENWPFASATTQVMQMIAEGSLGQLFMVKAAHESALFGDLATHATKHPWGLDPATGGYLLRAGIHSLALAREILGDYEAIFAFASDNRGFDREVPDTETVVSARFRSGAVGSFNYTGRSRHLGPRRMQLTLFGTQGHVFFDLLTGEVVATADGVETTIRSSRASLGYAEEIQHFVDCIRTSTPPRTGFREQLKGLAAVLAAYRSLDERRPVSPDELG